MRGPRHTPYDGTSRLFEIGLKPLDAAEWIDIDDSLETYLDEKDRLLAGEPDEVFVAEPGTEAAQNEVLALLLAHLPQRFPDVYRREDETMRIGPARTVALTNDPPLLTAARLVPEDLVLMRRCDSGWRMAAMAVAFPSSWRPREKFGLAIDAIHAPVPGFGAGTRPAELIARMFDHLQPGRPVLRWNWSVYGDGRLAHRDSATPDTRRFGNDAHTVFLRAERQTLRKLPDSGDIVFTIRIFIDPLAELERHSDAARIAAALADQLMALTPEQRDYKGLTAERDAVVARLRRIGR